jgi:hypothetical protein
MYKAAFYNIMINADKHYLTFQVSILYQRKVLYFDSMFFLLIVICF